jgi:ADP-ribose pyrophosphatase YjhB (NUDIX family)
MREYPDRPIVGVGAVVVDGDRVLLVRRGHEPLKGEWSLPGGGVEVGETLEAAIAREVLEETGLQVEVAALVDVIDRISRDDEGRVRYHYVLIDFVCRPVGGVLCCATDADDATWVAIADLPLYRLPEATLAMVRKAFSGPAGATRNTPAPRAAR